MSTSVFESGAMHDTSGFESRREAAIAEIERLHLQAAYVGFPSSPSRHLSELLLARCCRFSVPGALAGVWVLPALGM